MSWFSCEQVTFKKVYDQTWFSHFLGIPCLILIFAFKVILYGWPSILNIWEFQNWKWYFSGITKVVTQTGLLRVLIYYQRDQWSHLTCWLLKVRICMYNTHHFWSLLQYSLFYEYLLPFFIEVIITHSFTLIWCKQVGWYIHVTSKRIFEMII